MTDSLDKETLRLRLIKEGYGKRGKVFKPLAYRVFTKKDTSGFTVQKIAVGSWIIEDNGPKNIISIVKVLAKDIFELDGSHIGKNIYYQDKLFPKMTEKIMSFKRI